MRDAQGDSEKSVLSRNRTLSGAAAGIARPSAGERLLRRLPHLDGSEEDVRIGRRQNEVRDEGRGDALRDVVLHSGEERCGGAGERGRKGEGSLEGLRLPAVHGRGFASRLFGCLRP